MPSKPISPGSSPILRTLAMPADTNPNGDVFGGWIMSQMDIAGGILAKETARSRMVTVAVDGFKFLRPVKVGDVVCCYGRVLRVGTTSIAIELEVWVKKVLPGIEEESPRFKVTEATFTYVAIDGEGKKRPIKIENPPGGLLGGCGADPAESRRTLITVLSIVTVSALVLAAASAPTETRMVTAGRPEYGQHSAFWRFHFGEGYRDLWTTPFEVEVLDLRTRAGGLVPVRQVGSMQSIGLALRGGDGRSYTFRTLDKDPTRILPPEWRTTLPARIFQDQTAAANPGSSFVAPALAEAAGVPHTNPAYVLMPDDPALDEFRETFGGKPGTLDEFPTGGEGGGFMGATEIIPTAELWKRWLEGRGLVDTQALVRARLFDMFLGDWDRHGGQWRWMRIPGREGYVPLPEDRDQALCDYGGIVLGSVRRTNPRFLEWSTGYDNVEGLLLQGRDIDRWLLTGLERDVFDTAAREMQAVSPTRRSTRPCAASPRPGTRCAAKRSRAISRSAATG